MLPRQLECSSSSSSATPSSTAIPPGQSLSTTSSISSSGKATVSKQTKGKPKVSRKNWFLTFPQNATSKEAALASLLAKCTGGGPPSLPKPLYIRIAQESHADGEPHLHIGLWLESAVSFRGTIATAFDFVAGKHGNYQPMKSQKGTYLYLQKADADPLEWGSRPPATLNARQSSAPGTTRSDSDKSEAGTRRTSKFLACANSLMSGSTLEEVNMSDPGFYLQNKRKIEDYKQFCSDQLLKESKAKVPGLPRYAGLHTATVEVIAWLSSNMFAPRHFKQQQLYLYGPPNTLKTTLVLLLEKYYAVYRIPMEEAFYDLYNDRYDLAFLDEFKGQIPMTWLNLWLQGAIMVLRKRYAQGLKTKNIPTIICSNYPPETAWSKLGATSALAPFLSRVKVVHVETPLDLANVYLGDVPLMPVELAQQISGSAPATSSSAALPADEQPPQIASNSASVDTGDGNIHPLDKEQEFFEAQVAKAARFKKTRVPTKTVRFRVQDFLDSEASVSKGKEAIDDSDTE